MQTFSQWMEGSRRSFGGEPVQGLPSFNRDNYSPSLKGGNSYSHHLAMFMKMAKQDGGRELTQDELEALERHKQIDKRARMPHKI